MKIQTALLSSLAFSLVLPAITRAADPEFLHPGPYVGATLGGSALNSAAVTQFGGSANGKVQFDAGPSFGIHGGYRVCEWFAIEGETGSIYNNISSLNGVNAFNVDAWVYQIPIMANVVLTLPTRTPVVPYIGAGVGGAWSVIDINNISATVPGGTVSLFGNDSTFTFAYQGFAGIQVAINPHMSVGAQYTYRHVESPDWTQDFPIEFGSLKSHTGSFSFNFRF